MTLASQLILAAKDPLGHNYDYPILSYNGWPILTNHMLMMILVTIFMLWWMPRVGRSVMTGRSGTSHDYVTKGSFAHIVEVICVFFRDDIARPVMGPFTDRFIPFIWTIFFFILFNNLLGMVPLLDATALVHKAFTSGDDAALVVHADDGHSEEGDLLLNHDDQHADERDDHAAGDEDLGHEHDAQADGDHDDESHDMAATGDHGEDAALADHGGDDHGDDHAEHAGSTSGFMWFQDLTNPGHSHFHGIGGTATGNIAVTFALALIAILVVILAAILNLGLGGFLHHLTLDAPMALWPLTVLLEIIGLIAKPFALMVRLFANMTAGHVMLAALLGFTSMAWNGIVAPPAGSFSVGGFLGFIPIAIGSVAFATAVGVLEILVAFIQAFVFAFLTTMFISMFLPHDHDHDHDHAHAHQGVDAEHPAAPEKAVTF